MTTGEDGEVLREKIARAIDDALPESDQLTLAPSQIRRAADAVLALIEPVMEENERLREGLNAIIDRAPERDIKWAGMNAHDIARSALSPKSEKRDG
jgi:hypothetical protein